MSKLGAPWQLDDEEHAGFSPSMYQVNLTAPAGFGGVLSSGRCQLMPQSRTHHPAATDGPPAFGKRAPTYLNTGEKCYLHGMFTLSESLRAQAERSAELLAGTGPCNLAAYTFARVLTARALWMMTATHQEIFMALTHQR